MTLIVGVTTGTRIQLLSDTRITHPDVTQIEEIPGRLKLVSLSPTICVGYGATRGATNGASSPPGCWPLSQHLERRSTWLPVEGSSRNSRSELAAGNPRTQIAWRCYGMRAPEIDRVRAAHDRMIGIDPNRDARVITFVSPSQPRACRLVDQPRHNSMFDRCTTDDHALDHEPVTGRAGDKCLTRPGAKPESRPKPARAGRSSAQSLDAGEHRTTLHWATAGTCTASTSMMSTAR